MKVDTIRLRAIELVVTDGGEMSWTEMDITEDVVDQLRANGFEGSGPLEFNLYDSGLAGSQSEP